LEIVGSLLQHLGSLIRGRFENIRASWIHYAVGTVLGVAILAPGILDTYDYFERFGKMGSRGRETGDARAVAMSKAARQYRETHQVWIDAHLLKSNLELDVLLWRPPKELNGKTIGGFSNPWYQMVAFTDWESFPYPKAGKPIAFFSSKRRTHELAKVFEGLEWREIPNWFKTGTSFFVSFIDPGDLEKKLAELRMNPDEDSESLWAQKGHGLLATYYDGGVWSTASKRSKSLAAAEEGQINKTQIDTSIDFFWPHSEKPAPVFSVEWKGFLQIDRSGEYVLATESDGGSAIYIDGRQVVDNWSERGRKAREAKLTLDKGLHALTIRYDDYNSVASVRFLWKTEGEPFSVVPAENLRVER
jgi:hypothetical protein